MQIVRLIIYYVKLFILGSTPRSVYGIKYIPGGVAWGTLFPSITLLVVISMCFSWSAKIDQSLTGFYLFTKQHSDTLSFRLSSTDLPALRSFCFTSCTSISSCMCTNNPLQPTLEAYSIPRPCNTSLWACTSNKCAFVRCSSSLEMAITRRALSRKAL